LQSAIALAWGLLKICSWSGLLAMILGVALFGRNLIRVTAAQARAEQKESLSPEIWRSRPAQRAAKIFCCGLALQALAIVLALVVPGRL